MFKTSPTPIPQTHAAAPFRERHADPAAVRRLTDAGVPTLLARLYAARGVRHPEELRTDFRALPPPSALRGCEKAAQLLADAIEAGARIVVIGDYDCDGATATAVAVRSLRAMGAEVAYLVPNRFTYGYGLSPAIVQLAHERFAPDVLVTVDNGIASFDGVAAANALGISVVITDHHLPGTQLPPAAAIVNPNQPGCPFPSKAIAGVGVIFYLMLALRAELRARGWFVGSRREPNLAQYLDLVALGTIADVVPLDHVNRIFVAQGLARIRVGQMVPGLAALFRVAQRQWAYATTQDLGFFLAPRLNAAGRLEDMAIGVACLTTDDPTAALQLAQSLEAINRERRTIEDTMRSQAEALLASAQEWESQRTLTLFHPEWHQGVIGILAGRLKEKLRRPVFTFAPHEGGLLKGSGRSVPGLHLRDALDWASKRHPDLFIAFGGHAMAAGATIRATDLERFVAAFEEAVAALGGDALSAQEILTDGPLPPEALTLDTAAKLEQEVWGQGFPAPVFSDTFEVTTQRLVGEAHLQLTLARDGVREAFGGMFFRRTEPLPPRITAAYQLAIDRYQGRERLRLMLEAAHGATL